MTACGTKIIYVRDPTKSTTELAVETLRGDWLKTCQRLDASVPDNNTGNLLLDYNDLTGVFEKCAAVHDSLVDYLVPIVEAEKKRKTAVQEEVKPATFQWPWKQD